MKKGNALHILTMAFYGNRTSTTIHEADVDRFILGYLSDTIKVTEPIDRTIIRVPNTEELVIIYNKYQEQDMLQNKEKWFHDKDYVPKPLVFIPEKGIKIYTRCIVCRQDAVTGELKSMQYGDFDMVCEYLAR